MARARRHGRTQTALDGERGASTPTDYAKLVARLPELTPLLIDVRRHLLASTNRLDHVLGLFTTAFSELRDVLQDLNAPPGAVEKIQELLADMETPRRTSSDAPSTEKPPRGRRSRIKPAWTRPGGSVKDRVRSFFESHPDSAFRAADVCEKIFPEEFRTDRAHIDMLVRKAFSKLSRSQPPQIQRFGDGRYQAVKTAKEDA